MSDIDSRILKVVAHVGLVIFKKYIFASQS